MERWEERIVMAWVVIEVNGVYYVSIWATNRKDWGREAGMHW